MPGVSLWNKKQNKKLEYVEMADKYLHICFLIK